MVNFLRDVMIVVALLATVVALALYPGPDGTPSAPHDARVGIADDGNAVAAPAHDVAKISFEKPPR